MLLRFKNLSYWVCGLLLLTSCGSRKQQILRGVHPPVLSVDSLKIHPDSLRSTVIEEAFIAQQEAPIPVVLTTEDKVKIMMRQGVNQESDWNETIHYDVRRPNFVIIHHTAQQSLQQTIRTFQLDHTKVSAHYVISRDGQVVQMLNDYLRSWHAGRSKWGNITDMNSVSIGIELDNNGREPFPDVQINALIHLLARLKSKYWIPSNNFIGHADVAPARKNDPSVLFPWKRLADQGFGIWYDEDKLVTPPDNFNYVDALRIIGYDVSNLGAAIETFKRKFIVSDVSKTLTDYDRKVLYNLYRKYL